MDREVYPIQLKSLCVWSSLFAVVFINCCCCCFVVVFVVVLFCFLLLFFLSPKLVKMFPLSLPMTLLI